MILEVAYSYGHPRTRAAAGGAPRAGVRRSRTGAPRVLALLGTLVALLAVGLAAAPSSFALGEGAFAEKAEAKPVVTVNGGRLSWEAVDPTGYYLLMRTPPHGEPEYALVRGTHVVPPELLHEAVGYRVKPATGSTWSAEVTVNYRAIALELEGTLPTLGEGSFAEKAESRPIVELQGETLVWEAVDPLGAYVVRRTLPGQEPEYAIVKTLRAKPPAIPASTVGYRVRALTGSVWSPEVEIDYAEEGQETEEGKGHEKGKGHEEEGEGHEEGEPPSGESSTVATAPTGPPKPAGGWYVAFADGFGAPLGTGAGRDNFWYPNRFCCDPGSDQPGFNSNELEVFNSSQVQVGSEGLELVDTHQPNTGGTGKNYVSGSVNTDLLSAPGYNLFKWTPGRGEKWAFECVCKLPRNTGEEDPGWWASDFPWTDELDFFEFWGWNTWAKYNMGITWIWKTPSDLAQSEHDLGAEFDPSAAFHRYTTVINPNDSIEEYIDGVRQTWLGKNGVLGPVSPTVVPMGLKLSNGLRGTGSKFTSGSRSFDIRSVAVYEDANHAGDAVSGGGIAPGTVVE